MVAGMVAAATAAAVLMTGGGPVAGDVEVVRAEADFAPPNAFVPSDAKTYDMELVPAGAHIQVVQVAEDPGNAVTLTVDGLKPNRAYGVHVHQKPCGARPEDAGGHYQHRKDPVQPSTDPAYVNPYNEVWLDFTTDVRGHGAAAARHGWNFRPGEAASVVLHREQGGAGDRLACFSVPFAPTRA
ncbi:superoxide dismutase family protein [Streptomyces sp. B-S-A8]|uniref:Superoxide dismutase family protein n=1 Tax=Streptomyces solicavernae TaxID=3043614 RepID=A0ABT6RZ18_9ACTN|nr:superoxide dismutase family protein [Streptomyces sp. B-S-A8]MDI3389686.1 superoxide dismutase family protein [Streptomyces sp. B-S-A8]